MSRPAAENPEHHRDVRGGAERAAVFGVSDGLVSNTSLILGIAGASSSGTFVRLAGMAGLIAGAVSMAAGEYISMQAQRELFEREIEKERQELEKHPHAERRELIEIYRSRGIDEKLAEDLATTMMADPTRALDTHTREELGIDPEGLGSPPHAAVSSFVSFVIGAFIPLVPWFFTDGTGAMVVSIVLVAVAALTVGTLLAQATGLSKLRSASRQLLFTAGAASVTYFVGSVVGVSTG